MLMVHISPRFSMSWIKISSINAKVCEKVGLNFTKEKSAIK